MSTPAVKPETAADPAPEQAPAAAETPGDPGFSPAGDGPPVKFSAAAAGKIRELLKEEDNDNLKLRVFVAGGGCSGFQYGFTFDEDQDEDDTILQREEVTLLIDSMSLQYLVGAEIDYQEKLEGSQFVIHNPNVTSTCGCGSSFSV